MAVTDLTNTTWALNGYIEAPSSTQYYEISFILEGNNVVVTAGDKAFGIKTTGIIVSDDNKIIYSFSDHQWKSFRFDNVDVYGCWITITGGSDATNASLIAWFEANAVQISADSLDGTKWNVKDTITNINCLDSIYFPNQSSNISNASIKYNINNVSYTDVLTYMYAPYSNNQVITLSAGLYNGTSWILMYFKTTDTYYANANVVQAGEGWYAPVTENETTTWQKVASDIEIEFTGNELNWPKIFMRTWLQQNATQLIPTSSTLNIYSNDERATSYGIYVQGGSYLTPTKVATVQRVSTITFTIGNGTYTADDGMTFGEWVNSAYNTYGFRLQGDGIFYAQERVGVVVCDFSITNNTTITANGTYVLFSQSACE